MNAKQFRILATAVVCLSVLPLVAGATAIITLPEGFVADTLAYVGQVFTDASLLIILVIGLPLGFWIIRKVIGLVRAR